MYLCLVCRLVAHDLAALVAAEDYNITALRIGQGAYGAQYSSALVCSVTGIYIHVQGAKAEWAMIARGVAEGQDLLAAIFAYKAGVVFCKSLVFHSLFSYAEF